MLILSHNKLQLYISVKSKIFSFCNINSKFIDLFSVIFLMKYVGSNMYLFIVTLYFFYSITIIIIIGIIKVVQFFPKIHSCEIIMDLLIYIIMINKIILYFLMYKFFIYEWCIGIYFKIIYNTLYTIYFINNIGTLLIQNLRIILLYISYSKTKFYFDLT